MVSISSISDYEMYLEHCKQLGKGVKVTINYDGPVLEMPADERANNAQLEKPVFEVSGNSSEIVQEADISALMKSVVKEEMMSVFGEVMGAFRGERPSELVAK